MTYKNKMDKKMDHQPKKGKTLKLTEVKQHFHECWVAKFFF